MLNIIEDALAANAGKCDYLEVRIEETTSTGIVIKGREIDAIREGLGRGGCARAFHNGGIGFVSFNSLDSAARAAGKAAEQAGTTGREKTMLAQVPTIREEIRATIVRDPREVTLEEKLRILQGYNDIILGSDPRIPTSSIGYGDGFRRVWFGNSEGTRLYYEKLDIGCNIVAVAVGEGQTQYGSVGCGSSMDFNCIFGLEEEIEAECHAAAAMLDAPSIKGGTYTAVLDPHLAGVFVHEAFGHMSEGEKTADNPRLAEVMKFGRKFGSEILNIHDTGLTPGARGAIPFDEEGVASENTELIREGVLVGRLHTRETAGRMGEKATGSARALGHQFAPAARMRNTCIAPGESSFEDMISGIELGVYAVHAMGGQAGEMFTFTPGRCYMIRNGKIEEMVKNAILSGNLFTTLKNIDMIGNDFLLRDAGGGCGKGNDSGFQFPLPVSHAAPHIRIRDVVIGGK